jgi:hypothetical protein
MAISRKAFFMLAVLPPIKEVMGGDMRFGNTLGVFRRSV